MIGKLIKHGHSYALIIDNALVAFAHPEDFSNHDVIGKLSLNNCRSIEYNCDFSKLIEEEYDKFDLDAKIVYRRQILDSLSNILEKTLSLVTDKQYSFADMTNAYNDNKIWLVEIENDVPFNYEGKDSEILGSYNKTINQNLYKLDNNGCLILKPYGND